MPESLAALPARDWPALQAIVDVDSARDAGWDPARYAAALLAGGAAFLQIRAKHLPAGALLRLCDDVVARAHAGGATVIVNDRADLALLAGADGVHVGQDDLPVDAARRVLGRGAVVGWSTHSTAQIADGLRTSATYLAVGPVFGTTTKNTGYAPVGLDMIRAARAATDRPLVAIGGMTLDNAASAIEAGATMVAVISDLLVGGDPAGRVRAYRTRLAGR